MKKLCVLLLVLLLAVSLAACTADTSKVYTATRDGVVYTVDREKGTISDGKFLYFYTFDGNSDQYIATITYPNHSTYNVEKAGMGIITGWSDDYYESAYVSGHLLMDILLENAPKPKMSAGSLFAAILVLGFGVFCIVKPRTVSYIRYSLWVKDAEPSEFAIFMCRIAGVLQVIAGIVMLF